jgi:hypothetical protein
MLGKLIGLRSSSQKRFIRGREKMKLKYEYESLDIHGLTIQETIALFQAWEADHTDASSTTVETYTDGESCYVEVAFQRPFTEEELAQQELNEKLWKERQEVTERAEYQRLKAKYEGS